MMRYVDVAGARMSAVGLGTWQFGSRDWGYGATYADKTARELTVRSLELGIDLFDTAEIYGFGRSERILGEALAERRDEAFIATKITPVIPIAPIVEQRAKASLKRLRTNRIDLYQVHAPNPVVPDTTTMAGMRRLVDNGLVKHVGVSNYPLSRWQSAERAFGGTILSNQVSFSLVDRRPLADLVPFAQSEGRIVIAYSPLAQGLLGGRYDKDNLPSGMARRMNPIFLPQALEDAAPLIDAVREIAKTHQCKPGQVALAWVISHPSVVAIPGASSVEQLESNAAAVEVTLTDAEKTQLEEAASRFEPPPRTAAIAAAAGSFVNNLRERYSKTVT
jgi:aryl-alcohol dehydrogenase-like predicted oxidoreductase